VFLVAEQEGASNNAGIKASNKVFFFMIRHPTIRRRRYWFPDRFRR
jgi:hypothetical protein